MIAQSHQPEVSGSDIEDVRQTVGKPARPLQVRSVLLSKGALVVAGSLLLGAFVASCRKGLSPVDKHRVVLLEVENLAQQPHASAKLARYSPVSHNVTPTSLFCFVLMLPYGTERDLIRWQLENHKSIFACDEWAVYSNETQKLSKDVSTRVVHTSLDCPIGGQWNTRLNTPIFMKLWKQVFNDNQFRLAAWAVKADPDAVFFPDRLRKVLSTPEHDKAQEGAGMFSDNCEYTHSMHGPLEVLSRMAVEVYGTKGESQCDATILQEDYYMRRCLAFALYAKPMPDFKLLAEQGCYWDWQTCTSGYVSYHPFKSVDVYRTCVNNAEGGVAASV